jgi:hypothetical protein
VAYDPYSQAPIFDAWTAVSFKRALGDRAQAGITWGLPSWTGDHQRRLMAYQILQSYVDNASRHFLGTMDFKAREDHREYGDAALIRDMVLSALLGEDQQVLTERADEFNPEQDREVDPEVGAADTGTDPVKPEPVDPQVRQAWEFQEWVNDWADQERLRLKVVETERNSVGLGDGVYSLGWSADKKRVRLRVWDPGFYFPVLDDGNEDDYPSKVHIAWEIPPLPSEQAGSQVKIRRITWEMVDSEPYTTAYAETGDEKATRVCVMSDGTWTLDLGGPQTIDDLSEGRVEWADYVDWRGNHTEWNQIRLDLDFIPVLHVPNTISLSNHYGVSSLSKVLQIIDDLAASDTDLQAASATTGRPVISLSGATMGVETDGPEKGKPKRVTYRPGEVFEIGDGKMDALDTSKSLDALTKYVESMLDRLSVNSRLPAALTGRVAISGQLAGITLQLSFGPLKAMIEEMRLVRQQKYRLLFKFLWRIAKVGKQEDAPDQYQPTDLVLGSFLPSDQSSAITAVTELLNVKPVPAISLETAVLMLIQAGLPIEDAAEEVRKIEERAFEAAVQLLEALGDEDAVFRFLNRKAPPVTPVSLGSGNAGGASVPGQVPPIPPPPGVPTNLPPGQRNKANPPNQPNPPAVKAQPTGGDNQPTQ